MKKRAQLIPLASFRYDPKAIIPITKALAPGPIAAHVFNLTDFQNRPAGKLIAVHASHGKPLVCYYGK